MTTEMQLRRLAAQGLTMGEAAEKVGIHYQGVRYHAERHGIVFERSLNSAKMVKYKGIVDHIKGHAERHGISPKTAQSRYRKYPDDLDRVFQPINQNKVRQISPPAKSDVARYVVSGGLGPFDGCKEHHYCPRQRLACAIVAPGTTLPGGWRMADLGKFCWTKKQIQRGIRR
jgi:hypothetical protein